MELAKFCSNYYQRPLGEVVAAALPSRLRSARPIPDAPRDYALTPAGADALAAIPSRHRRLRALLRGSGRVAHPHPNSPRWEPKPVEAQH